MLLGEYLIKFRDYLFKPDDVLNTPLVHFFGVCERQQPDNMFAEPLNVLSSIGFFIAAFLIFNKCRNHPEIKNERKLDIHVLNILMVAIGCGSIIFHMAPSHYTELLDITFIVIFINLFFFSFLVRIAKLKIYQIVVTYLAFTGSTHMLVSQFPNAMNDSIAYLSSVFTVVFIAFYLRIKRRSGSSDFMLAAVLGLISLFFRSIDNYVCDQIRMGTHFMWHSLNAFVMYLLMKQLVRSINRRARMLRLAALASNYKR